MTRENGRFRPDPEAVAQRLGDEIVLVHLETNRIHVLNSTGARVWELFAAGHDLAEVHRRLLAEYDVQEDRLVREVGELLGVLLRERFIVKGDADD